MFAKSHCRSLPVFLPTISSRFEAIDLAGQMIDQLFAAVTDKGRLLRSPEGERVLLLASNLQRAAAEMSLRGTVETLSKTRDGARSIALHSKIKLSISVPLPDLRGLPLDPLPAILGIGEDASEWEEINGVRCLLDDCYLDDAATHDQRVELALLWASLPRAEAEIEHLGRTKTLDRIQEVAREIAARFRGQNLMAA